MPRRALLDAHFHLWEYSLFNILTDLSRVSCLEETYEMMRRHPVRGWMIGSRFNEDHIKEKIIPDRSMLDKTFGSTPAAIVRACLHLTSMNTAAMQALGLQSDNGIFPEAFKIMNLVTMKLHLDPGKIITQGLDQLKKMEVTRVIDMAMDTYKRNLLAGKKVYFYTTDFQLLDEAVGFKLFLDGGLGARGAALTEEYSDDPGNFGMLEHSDEELLKLVEKVHQADKPIACHIIGDRALDQFFRVIKLSRHPMDRVDHIQYARPEQLDWLAELKIPACIEPIFSRELDWAADRLGPERIKTAYAWNLMLEKGIYLMAGSDAPVDDADPVVGARTSDALLGNQHLDFEKAMELYSVNNWRFYGWQPEAVS